MTPEPDLHEGCRVQGGASPDLSSSMSPHPGRTGASFQTAGCCDSARNSPWRHQNRKGVGLGPPLVRPLLTILLHKPPALSPEDSTPGRGSQTPPAPAPGSHLLTVSAQTREWVISGPQGLAGLRVGLSPGLNPASVQPRQRDPRLSPTTESARPHLQHRTSTIPAPSTAVLNVASISPLPKKREFQGNCQWREARLSQRVRGRETGFLWVSREAAPAPVTNRKPQAGPGTAGTLHRRSVTQAAPLSLPGRGLTRGPAPPRPPPKGPVSGA